jgi:hypothetical protein
MKAGFRFLLMVIAVFALAIPAFAAIEDAVETIEGTPVPLNIGGNLVCGGDVYNNTTSPYFSTTSLPRWHILDDGSFAAGTAPVTVECIEFSFNQSAAGQIYVAVNFYDTLVPGGPVCNLALLGGVTVNFGVQPIGAFTSGLLTLPVPVTFPDNSWCVELAYLSSLAPVTPSPTGTTLFSNGVQTVGSNDATTYYRDADGNGTFACPGEARGFAAPSRAAVYLRLQRQVPTSTEPTTWGNVKGLYR